jgi:putative transposase
MTAINATDPRRLLDLAMKGKLADCMAAIQFLELQIRILAKRIEGRLTIKPAERRELRKFGKPLGDRVDDFVKIVTPETWHRWGRKGKSKARTGAGRPKTAKVIEDLVVKMAEENAWGLTRIYGELRKLGLAHRIARTTVRNILLDHGFDPEPKRGPGTWAEFIEIHRKSLWCCDFLTKKIETPTGQADYHILFFKQIDTKEVYIAGATEHPDDEWTTQQARNFCMFLQDGNRPATKLVCDQDTKFTGRFDAVFEGEGMEVVRTSRRAPEMNGFAETFVKTLKRECLDHFTVFGPAHLDRLMREFSAFYNQFRPHRNLGNRPLPQVEPPPKSGDFTLEDIVAEERLGGLLRHYRWRDAA